MFGFNPREHPSLPQNDTRAQQEKRADQIASAKTDYIWNDNAANAKGVPLSKDIPPDEKPTLSWYLTVLDVALEIVKNTLILAAAETKPVPAAIIKESGSRWAPR